MGQVLVARLFYRAVEYSSVPHYFKCLETDLGGDMGEGRPFGQVSGWKEGKGIICCDNAGKAKDTSPNFELGRQPKAGQGLARVIVRIRFRTGVNCMKTTHSWLGCHNTLFEPVSRVGNHWNGQCTH